MSSLSIAVKCHAGDLEELVYRAREHDGAVAGGKPIIGKKNSPTDFLIVALFLPAVSQTVRKSKLASLEEALGKKGRLICKLKEEGKKKIQVFSCAAIISKTSSGYFLFQR